MAALWPSDRSIQCSSGYLKVRWHHSEIDKLRRNPQLPVGYHRRLQVIAQLVLDLMTLTLHCMQHIAGHAPAAAQTLKLQLYAG